MKCHFCQDREAVCRVHAFGRSESDSKEQHDSLVRVGQSGTDGRERAMLPAVPGRIAERSENVGPQVLVQPDQAETRPEFRLA